MSHRSVRLFIENTAKSLADNINFTYARTSDFNVIRDKKFPYIVLDPLTATPAYSVDGVSNYSKAWTCNMAFYQLDTSGSTGEQYAKILDDMDLLVDRFINKLNTYSTLSDSVLIESISQQPFIKATADILTGYFLTFTLVVADDFEYCDIDCRIESNDC
jgi:hypothetical protein